MPTITPPSDEPYYVVTGIDIESKSIELTQVKFDRIQHFLNVKPWTCPNCEATVFGRSLRCYCKTERPKDFKLEPK